MSRLLGGAFVLLAACGGDLTTPQSPTPNTLVSAAGTYQGWYGVWMQNSLEATSATIPLTLTLVAPAADSTFQGTYQLGGDVPVTGNLTAKMQDDTSFVVTVFGEGEDTYHFLSQDYFWCDLAHFEVSTPLVGVIHGDSLKVNGVLRTACTYAPDLVPSLFTVGIISAVAS